MDDLKRLAAALALSRLRAALKLSNGALCRLLAGGPLALLRRADGGGRLDQELARLLPACEDEAERLRARGIFAVYADHPALAFRLSSVEPPAAFFFARGEASIDACFGGRTAALVGSRRPSPYGRRITTRLAADLCRKNVTVISGGARGIDAVAHEAALKAGGLTVAVLGQGVDVVYPAENGRLFDAVAAGGLLLSEYAPGVRPKRYHFPTRNRLVSGLADVVIVSEAAANSGTLITAGFAADQGRDVFAVPGPVDLPGSAGCHRLIREGAGLICSADDIDWPPARLTARSF